MKIIYKIRSGGGNQETSEQKLELYKQYVKDLSEHKEIIKEEEKDGYMEITVK